MKESDPTTAFTELEKVIYREECALKSSAQVHYVQTLEVSTIGVWKYIIHKTSEEKKSYDLANKGEGTDYYAKQQPPVINLNAIGPTTEHHEILTLLTGFDRHLADQKLPKKTIYDQLVANAKATVENRMRTLKIMKDQMLKTQPESNRIYLALLRDLRAGLLVDCGITHETVLIEERKKLRAISFKQKSGVSQGAALLAFISDYQNQFKEYQDLLKLRQPMSSAILGLDEVVGQNTDKLELINRLIHSTNLPPNIVSEVENYESRLQLTRNEQSLQKVLSVLQQKGNQLATKAVFLNQHPEAKKTLNNITVTAAGSQQKIDQLTGQPVKNTPQKAKKIQSTTGSSGGANLGHVGSLGQPAAAPTPARLQWANAECGAVAHCQNDHFRAEVMQERAIAMKFKTQLMRCEQCSAAEAMQIKHLMTTDPRCNFRHKLCPTWSATQSDTEFKPGFKKGCKCKTANGYRSSLSSSIEVSKKAPAYKEWQNQFAAIPQNDNQARLRKLQDLPVHQAHFRSQNRPGRARQLNQMKLPVKLHEMTVSETVAEDKFSTHIYVELGNQKPVIAMVDTGNLSNANDQCCIQEDYLRDIDPKGEIKISHEGSHEITMGIDTNTKQYQMNYVEIPTTFRVEGSSNSTLVKNVKYLIIPGLDEKVSFGRNWFVDNRGSHAEVKYKGLLMLHEVTPEHYTYDYEAAGIKVVSDQNRFGLSHYSYGGITRSVAGFPEEILIQPDEVFPINLTPLLDEITKENPKTTYIIDMSNAALLKKLEMIPGAQVINRAILENAGDVIVEMQNNNKQSRKIVLEEIITLKEVDTPGLTKFEAQENLPITVQEFKKRSVQAVKGKELGAEEEWLNKLLKDYEEQIFVLNEELGSIPTGM